MIHWKTFVKNLVINNWRTKIMALLLAITVWVYLNTIVHKTVTVHIPLSVEDAPPSAIIVLSTAGIKFQLKGPGNIVQDFALKQLQGKFSLKDVQMAPGERVKKIKVPGEKFLDLPVEIKVLKPVMPEMVEILIYRTKTKLLQVQPELRYQAGKNYQIVKVTCNPSLVLAKIPTIALDPKNKITTDVVHLGQINTAGEIAVPVKLSSQIGDFPVEYLTEHQEAIVTIVVRESVSKKLPIKIQIITRPDFALPEINIIDKLPAEVELFGPNQWIKEYSQFPIYIDLSDWEHESRLFPLITMAPREIQLLTELPSHVRVEAKKKKFHRSQ